MKPIRNTMQSGFTLVELLVSLSLFIIIVLALVGSLYTVNDASRKVQAMRSVMDNLNFAMESIGRTVRTSEHITCSFSANCSLFDTGGSTSISMQSTLGEHRQVEYRLTITNGRGRIEKKSTGLIPDPSNPGSYILDASDVIDWQTITSPEIDVDRALFYVDGALASDGQQPNVILQLDGTASVPGGVVIPFAIQTYLSQRTPE